MNKHKLISTDEKYWLQEVISNTNMGATTIINTSSLEPNIELLSKLYEGLDNHYITYKGGDKELWIKKGINTKIILEQKELFINAATDFRETAQLLMQKLGIRYAIDITSNSELSKFKVLSDWDDDIQCIDEQWEFNFHGFECLIRNINTGQTLNIIYTNTPEFGILDPSFFLKYINTTDQWSELKELLNDSYEVTNQALLTLEAYGYLNRVFCQGFSSRGLIVKL